MILYIALHTHTLPGYILYTLSTNTEVSGLFLFNNAKNLAYIHTHTHTKSWLMTRTGLGYY